MDSLFWKVITELIESNKLKSWALNDFMSVSFRHSFNISIVKKERTKRLSFTVWVYIVRHSVVCLSWAPRVAVVADDQPPDGGDGSRAVFKWMRSTVSTKKEARKHITHHLREGASWTSFFLPDCWNYFATIIVSVQQHFSLRHCTCYNSYHSYTCSWADALTLESKLFYTQQAYFFHHGGKWVGFCLDGAKNGAFFKLLWSVPGRFVSWCQSQLTAWVETHLVDVRWIVKHEQEPLQDKNG